LARLPAVLIAAAGSLALAYIAYTLRDSYIGDAAIYLPYARNAADGHLFQFNVGEFSSGSTSPLWALVLAVPYLFGAGIGGAKVMAALMAVAAFLTTVAAARRVSGSWTAAAVASLVVVGTMGSYAVGLYESGLVVALSALALIAGARAVEAWRDAGRLDARAAAPLVAVWAALPLARPDAVVLVGAQAVALLAFAPVPWRRAFLPLAAALALAAVPAAAYFGYSLAELGTASTSSQGRAFALQESAAKLFGPLYRTDDAVRELASSPWVFAVVPALAGLALLARRAEGRWVAGYGGLGLLAYVVLLSVVAPAPPYEATRYLVPVLPIVAAGAAYTLSRARGTRLWVPAVAVGALAIGISSGLEADDRVDVLRSFGIGKTEVFETDVSSEIERRARPGDVVLAYEVQLRYYLRDDLEVLSQDGIIDGKVRPYQDEGEITAFLRRYRPRWWIADANVNFRRYLHGTVLQRAFHAFKRDPAPPVRTLDGIRFELVARRDRPLERGFGGWQMLFRLDYP
jgi:hypothetical protein